MKIREWLSSLDDLYRLYAGTAAQPMGQNLLDKELDYQLFAVANMQDDAEKLLKESVVSFLNHEYDGRVDRLIASDVHIHPRYTKLMHAFYKYMNSLGKYRLYLFCDIPDICSKKDMTFTDVYLHFRMETFEWKQNLHPQKYASNSGYPTGPRLKDEFNHWKLYIKTEMCNDGFDSNVIWKKMVDLLCSCADVDRMLRNVKN